MAKEDRVRCDAVALPSSLMDRNSLYEPVIQQSPHQDSYTSISGSARAHLGDHLGNNYYHQHAGMVESWVLAAESTMLRVM